MKLTKKGAIALMLFLFFVTTAAQAGSPVWKISDKSGTHHVFIGGTIHVLSKEDYPLPKIFDLVYAQSSIVVFEANIAEAQKPEFTQAFVKSMTYSGSHSLRDFIQPETWQALSKFVLDRKISISTISQFKPGLITIMLTGIEMERLGMTGGQGIDEFYFQKATWDKKTMDFLESPMVQVRLLGTEEGSEDVVVKYFLAEIEKLGEDFAKMKKVWRTGDTVTLHKITAESFKKEFPKSYEEVFPERNKNWLSKILEMLKTPEVEFVLVGAAHLGGDQGLLSLLREKGFLITNQ
jgi:uncharacterized protein